VEILKKCDKCGCTNMSSQEFDISTKQLNEALQEIYEHKKVRAQISAYIKGDISTFPGRPMSTINKPAPPL